MKRISALLTVVALIAVMVVMSSAVAFAGPPTFTSGGSQGKGASVAHCQGFGGSGNSVHTPSGNSNSHCHF